jgi:hypothetical protein
MPNQRENTYYTFFNSQITQIFLPVCCTQTGVSYWVKFPEICFVITLLSYYPDRKQERNRNVTCQVFFNLIVIRKLFTGYIIKGKQCGAQQKIYAILRQRQRKNFLSTLFLHSTITSTTHAQTSISFSTQ